MRRQYIGDKGHTLKPGSRPLITHFRSGFSGAILADAVTASRISFSLPLQSKTTVATWGMCNVLTFSYRGQFKSYGHFRTNFGKLLEICYYNFFNFEPNYLAYPFKLLCLVCLFHAETVSHVSHLWRDCVSCVSFMVRLCLICLSYAETDCLSFMARLCLMCLFYGETVSHVSHLCWDCVSYMQRV